MEANTHATSRQLTARTPTRTPNRSPAEPPSIRVSSYPQRIRTPVQRSPSGASQQDRVGTSASCAENQAEDLLQLTLVVQPIVKSTIGQRDSSGATLDEITVSGVSFAEIMSSLFAQLLPRRKRRAVKMDETWTQQPAVLEEWPRLMQFRFKRHVIESTKSDEAWNQWVKSTRRQTVHLLVYEYGITITKAQDLQEFKETCVTPPVTDRSGAAAEVTLQDMARQLQQHWADTYQASSVVWRMWANHIARNLNRSTWEAAVLLSPPDYILPMLNAANTRLEQHLSNLNRSVSMALDVVEAFFAENAQMQRDHDAFDQRLKAQKNGLISRKEIIQAFIHELPPLARQAVVDPLPAITNIADTEHE